MPCLVSVVIAQYLGFGYRRLTDNSYGMITTYPLLFSSNEQTRQNVIANFDWLFPNGISPSGFFWDSGEKGNKWYGGDIRKPQAKNWHLIRKSADALYYIIKQFDLMNRQGITVKPLWENGTRGVADAFVKLWQQNHQFGQFVDSQTGEIAVGGSSGGGLAPAALMMASAYYKDKKYEAVALESAQALYDNFVQKGISCGGPGDALQNPDSESQGSPKGKISPSGERTYQVCKWQGKHPYYLSNVRHGFTACGYGQKEGWVWTF